MKTHRRFYCLALSLAALLSCKGPVTASDPQRSLGGVSGGGGKGVLCDGRLRTLDFYEAEEVYHWRLFPDQGTFRKNAVTYLLRMIEYFSPKRLSEVELQKYRDLIARHIEKNMEDLSDDIPSGTRLPLTADATVPPLPSGCREVQIIIYGDNERMLRDPDYWSRLSSQDQVALYAHEMLYSEARRFGSSTSDSTRKYVASAFSTGLVEPFFGPILDSAEKIHCFGGRNGTGEELFELYAADERREGRDGLGMYFEHLKTTLMMFRTSAFVPGVTATDLRAGNVRFTTTVFNPAEGRSWELSLEPGDSPGTIRIRARNEDGSMPPRSLGHCEAFDPGESVFPISFPSQKTR